MLASNRLKSENSEMSGDEAVAAGWAPWRQGVKDAWPHTAGTTDAAQDMSRAEFESSVNELADEAIQLLRAALPTAAKEYPALFDSKLWSHILGMLDLNCMGIRVGCPIKQYIDGVNELSTDSECNVDAQNDLAELCNLLPGVDECYCDGTGFFSIQSIINHACDPNALSGKHVEDSDGKIVIRAVRDIEAGEELFISYIEVELPVEVRQAQLMGTYNFECTCNRCVKELSQSSTKKKRKGS